MIGSQTIDIARFQALLDAHGGVLSRWPANARVEAQHLLKISATARAALDAQQRLEAILDADPAPVPGAALREAILARAPVAQRRWRGALGEFWAALGGVRVAGPAFAAALVLGLSLGVTMTAPDGETGEDVDLLALAQLSDEYLEY